MLLFYVMPNSTSRLDIASRLWFIVMIISIIKYESLIWNTSFLTPSLSTNGGLVAHLCHPSQINRYDVNNYNDVLIERSMHRLGTWLTSLWTFPSVIHFDNLQIMIIFITITTDDINKVYPQRWRPNMEKLSALLACRADNWTTTCSDHGLQNDNPITVIIVLYRWYCVA